MLALGKATYFIPYPNVALHLYLSGSRFQHPLIFILLIRRNNGMIS